MKGVFDHMSAARLAAPRIGHGGLPIAFKSWGDSCGSSLFTAGVMGMTRHQLSASVARLWLSVDDGVYSGIPYNSRNSLPNDIRTLVANRPVLIPDSHCYLNSASWALPRRGAAGVAGSPRATHWTDAQTL